MNETRLNHIEERLRLVENKLNSSLSALNLVGSDMVGSAEHNPLAGGLEKTVASHGIGWAIKQMEDGLLVRRSGWKSKGEWLGIQGPDYRAKMSKAYVYISVVDGSVVPWMCSQANLLATDWELA